MSVALGVLLVGLGVGFGYALGRYGSWRAQPPPPESS